MKQNILYNTFQHFSEAPSCTICNIVITKTITTKQFYTGTGISNQQENIYKHSYKTTNQDTEEMTKHLIINIYNRYIKSRNQTIWEG